MATLSPGRAQQIVVWSHAKLIAFRFAFAIAALSAHAVIGFAPNFLPFQTVARPIEAALGLWDASSFRATMSLGAFIIRMVTGSHWTVHELIWQHRWSMPVLVLSDLLGLLVLAAFVAIAWTAVDRTRASYSVLNRGLRVYLRYAVGAVMLVYALNKVIPTQFGVLTPGEMLRPIGQLPRFLLLWDFMASSPGYTIFTGMIELTGASLLFFRRTSLLGALVLACTLTNVVAIDICYQVGAVHYAIVLLLLDLILLAPYLPELSNLVLGQRADAFLFEPATLRQHWYRSPLAILVFLCLLASPLAYTHGISWRHSHITTGQPVCGLFDVTSFVRNGKTVIPLANDNATWKRVSCDNRSGEPDGWGLSVQFANGDVRRLALTDDTVNRIWTIHDENPRGAGSLHYVIRQNGNVSLDGRIGRDSVDILLHPVDATKFFLILKPA